MICSIRRGQCWFEIVKPMNTVHGTPLAQPVTQTQLVEAPQPMSVPKAYEQSCSVQP